MTIINLILSLLLLQGSPVVKPVVKPKVETILISDVYQIRGPATITWIKITSTHKDGPLCTVLFVPMRWEQYVAGMAKKYVNINPQETVDKNFEAIGKILGSNEMKEGESWIIDPKPNAKEPTDPICAKLTVTLTH